VISIYVSSPVAIISSKDDHNDDFSSGELSARCLLAATELPLSETAQSDD